MWQAARGRRERSKLPRRQRGGKVGGLVKGRIDLAGQGFDELDVLRLVVKRHWDYKKRPKPRQRQLSQATAPRAQAEDD